MRLSVLMVDLGDGDMGLVDVDGSDRISYFPQGTRDGEPSLTKCALASDP